MKISPITFAKGDLRRTLVDISRQDIDWTSLKHFGDILIRDLADQYAVETEGAVAERSRRQRADRATPASADTLGAWASALYNAAASSYANGKRMPDRIWCSIDVWATLGALVDIARFAFPPDGSQEYGGQGASSLADFRGDVLGLPRIVVPTFPAGTCIVGPSTLFEVYEQVIGLLSVVEPSILGVTVAYGGYLAHGSLDGPAFVPVTPPAAPRGRRARRASETAGSVTLTLGQARDWSVPVSVVSDEQLTLVLDGESDNQARACRISDVDEQPALVEERSRASLRPARSPRARVLLGLAQSEYGLPRASPRSTGKSSASRTSDRIVVFG